MICIVFGILVIVFEELLQWIVGLFLLIQGILLLTDYLELRKNDPTQKLILSLFFCYGFCLLAFFLSLPKIRSDGQKQEELSEDKHYQHKVDRPPIFHFSYNLVS